MKDLRDPKDFKSKPHTLQVLEEAKAAVGNIKKDNLNEIRSLKLPPEPIRDVLEGVLRLMNNQVPIHCYLHPKPSS